MRKIIRFLLAVILGFVAFEAVDLWPVRPMWVQGKDPANSFEILGFSSERKSLLVSQEFNEGRHTFSTDIVEYDVETGTERNHWNFQRKEGDWFPWQIHAFSDARKLFVDYVPTDTSRHHSNEGYLPHRFKIIDARDGKTLSGPFEFEGSEEVSIAPDGRWIWTHRGYCRLIISVDTGAILLIFREVLLGFREQSDRSVTETCCFAADGSAVAIIWYNRKTRNHSLAIHELPSGQKRGEYELPPGPGWRLRKWEQEKIYVNAHRTIGGQTIQTEVHSFALTKDGLGPAQREPYYDECLNEETHRKGRTETMDAGPRIALLTLGSPEVGWKWWHDGLVWLDKKFGSDFSKFNMVQPHVRLLDKQMGVNQYEFTSRDLLYPLKFSPDGRRVASVHPEKGLMMWNADPFPRWPWALGTGLLMALVVWFFPSMRRRSRVPIPSQIS